MTIRSSMNLKSRPFILRPSAKDYLWGGNRLNDEFEKNIDMSPLAETWECSTHPDGPSVVATGEFTGRTLSDVLYEHPEFVGMHPLENSKIARGELPILIKFIDANKDLSVQVHPDDEYAFKNENGQKGKTEVWYVLDATHDATLTYGLQFELTKDSLKSKIENGTLENYLQKVPVKKDDVFFIEAGTIHAIGAGTLLAEIQENSNLTYRIYDYDRVDKFGNKRQLHIERALEVADLSAATKPRQSMRVLRYKKGCARELLCRCKYFEVYRMLLNTERARDYVSFRADEESFRVLLCTKGCGSVIMEDGQTLNFFKGDCIFMPADSMECKLHGRAHLLDVRG